MQHHPLERKIPPVILFVIALAAQYFSLQWFENFTVFWPYPLVGYGVCLLFSLGFGLGGVWAFYVATTTVDPIRLEKTTTMVTDGVFRFSRNPMYLGLAFLLLGIAYYLQNAAALVVVWLFVLYLQRFQIEPEERFLVQHFGDVYRDYQARVRRWL